MALLLAGCSKPLFTGVPRYMREQGGLRVSGGGTPVEPDSEAVDSSVSQPRSIYVTALKENTFLLFKDGKLISSAAAGDNPDPERHRVREGRLWTDAIDGKETVVYRDGKEFLRWAGEELFAGFLLRDGHLHTLGQKPGDRGFSYRIDGEEVFSDKGRVIGSMQSPYWPDGAFTSDSAGVWYCYGLPQTHSGGTTWEYRVMRGPDTISTIPDDASGAVWDIRVYDGVVYRAEKRKYTHYLVSGSESGIIATIPYESPDNMSLALYEGRVCICGHSIVQEKFSYSWCREPLKMNDYFAADYGYRSHLLNDGAVSVRWQEKDSRVYAFDWEKNGRYTLATPLCTVISDGIVLRAFTDGEGAENLVICGKSMSYLNLDGTLLSIRYE